MHELHRAVYAGSIERTLAVLSRGGVDIDQGAPDALGSSPLMIAAGFGHSRIVKILLSKGATVLSVDDGGGSALHLSAQGGHLAIAKVLVKAGADLESKASSRYKGCTPLHMAAERGHSEVARVLIEAGTNPDNRAVGGATPLYLAAQNGHLE